MLRIRSIRRACAISRLLAMLREIDYRHVIRATSSKVLTIRMRDETRIRIYRGSYEMGKAGKRWGAYTLLSWRRRDADRRVSERTSARVNEVQRGSFEYERITRNRPHGRRRRETGRRRTRLSPPPSLFLFLSRASTHTRTLSLSLSLTLVLLRYQNSIKILIQSSTTYSSFFLILVLI